MRSIFVLVLVLATAAACAPAAPTPVPTSTTIPTATPNAEATATAQAQAATTFQAQASSTALAFASATAAAQFVATSQAKSTADTQAYATLLAQQTVSAAATTQARDNYVKALIASAQKGFGPTDGVLEYTTQNATTFTIPTFHSNVNLRNFIVEARFSNPSDSTSHSWDYGFAFRSALNGKCSLAYRFFLDSSQNYDLDLFTGKTNNDATCEDRITKKGFVGRMVMAPSGENAVRLVVQDGATYIYVNGEFVSIVDTSDINTPGDVWIGTSMLARDTYAGLRVRYAGFAISALP